VITDGHRIDFTDRVEIGRRAIIGGRNSSLWTHNRQRTAPLRVGEFAYVASEIRMTPGAAVPARSIVGVGSVVVDDLAEHVGTLIAGVPAKVLKPLSEHDQSLVERKTRADLPDDV
jgi:acetyltransferase-like isoleucine patch superfamily enzyme